MELRDILTIVTWVAIAVSWVFIIKGMILARKTEKRLNDLTVKNIKLINENITLREALNAHVYEEMRRLLKRAAP